jgi:hypothetical protein
LNDIVPPVDPTVAVNVATATFPVTLLSAVFGNTFNIIPFTGALAPTPVKLLVIAILLIVTFDAEKVPPKPAALPDVMLAYKVQLVELFAPKLVLLQVILALPVKALAIPGSRNKHNANNNFFIIHLH